MTAQIKISNRGEWEPSDRELPMSLRHGSGGCFAVFLILMGLTVMGLPLTAGIPESFRIGMMAAFITPGLAGLALLLFGFYALFYGSLTTISRDAVRFEQYGLVPLKWESPLSDYKGILKRVKVKKSGRVKCRVVLAHRNDRGRNITLYKTREAEYVDERLQHFAKLLGLPVISE